MAQIYSFDGVVPAIDPTAFVHPSAVVIGDVIIGAGVYVAPCASLRGDLGRIIIGAGANIQDTVVVHGFPDTDTTIEENGHIGHGAILHACTLQRNVLVGMNAVVMDYTVVGESAIIAASAFVAAQSQIPARSLAMGVPAKIVRKLTDEELAWKLEATATYQRLCLDSRRSMVPCVPLAEPEANRRRCSHSGVVALSELKRHIGAQ
ncbi:MAG TPA: phenylacetic acid degradation protein PaaY [Burkholderiaceae bacterium]|nr:phenylacetic acid degradation protein PaaY [Burkholderiaceae bacterium]